MRVKQTACRICRLNVGVSLIESNFEACTVRQRRSESWGDRRRRQLDSGCASDTSFHLVNDAKPDNSSGRRS
jgi:hypothetical protein